MEKSPSSSQIRIIAQDPKIAQRVALAIAELFPGAVMHGPIRNERELGVRYYVIAELTD